MSHAPSIEHLLWSQDKTAVVVVIATVMLENVTHLEGDVDPMIADIIALIRALTM